MRAFINGADIKPNVYEGMWHAVDYLPSMLNAAIGVPVEIKGIDGVNLWPVVTQNLPSKRNSFIYLVDPLGTYGCEGVRI